MYHAKRQGKANYQFYRADLEDQHPGEGAGNLSASA